MSSAEKEPFDSPSNQHLESKLTVGFEDIDTKAIDLLNKPDALLNFLLDLQKPSITDPIITSLVFYLLPRLKLNLQIGAKLLDQRYASALLNSSIVNKTYELLPERYKELFGNFNLFSGFMQCIACNDISLDETDRIRSVLSISSQKDSTSQKTDFGTFRLSLELLLDDAQDINDCLGSETLPSYQQLRSNQSTSGLIDKLGDYFTKNDYSGVNYEQLVLLMECIAYVRRFARKSWRVEIEDVLEAWFFVNYYRTPRPPLKRNEKEILQMIELHNRQDVFPTQRKIIKKTNLAIKTVNKALGLNINSRDGRGSLLVDRYVDYDESRKGYCITELGKIALTNDFYINVGQRTYRPKNPLKPQE